MFRFALDLKAGTRAPEVCQKKTLNGFFEVNDPLSEKVRNPKEFTTIPIIDVLCSNFKDIGRREVRETMTDDGDEKLRRKMRFFSTSFCARFWKGTKSLQASVWPGPTSVKFRPNWFQFAGVICGKWLRTTAINYSLCLWLWHIPMQWCGYRPTYTAIN